MCCATRAQASNLFFANAHLFRRDCEHVLHRCCNCMQWTKFCRVLHKGIFVGSLDVWRVLGNHGLGWKSKLFSTAKNVKKSEKVHFLKLQVWQMISQTLYGLGTSSLAYLTHYNQYLMILHYPWLRVKNKPFISMKNMRKWKSSLFETPTSTSDFSDPIWTRAFGVCLYDSL